MACLGTVGRGQVRSAERLDEQNCCMRSYRYHCLGASSLWVEFPQKIGPVVRSVTE